MKTKLRQSGKTPKPKLKHLLAKDCAMVLLSEAILVGLFFLLPIQPLLLGLNIRATAQENQNQTTKPFLITAVSTDQIIKLTNQKRIENGLLPLLVNQQLTQAAQERANDMLAKNYFSHETPDGQNFSQNLRAVNYHYNFAGENLAMDFFTNQTIIDRWLASPKHRDNLLNPDYQETGVAVATGLLNNRPTVLVVQLFGGQRQTLDIVITKTSFGRFLTGQD